MDEQDRYGGLSTMSDHVQQGLGLTVLVTGANGQLGQELVRLELEGVRIVGLGRDELDITDAQQCLSVIALVKPDIVIHAAAYTAVDRAESEPEAAWLVNVEGTRNVAKAAEAIGAKLCYVSTDYVFDGSGTKPYEEKDVTNPRTVYGNTKLEGERAAAESCSRLFIVRTSWVYGRYGNNFVKTMLKLASERDTVTVVHDQIGAPTYTYDLALFLIELIKTDKYAVYHASNGGVCSWYEFANAIFEEANIRDVRVVPCTTEQFPRPAPRPAYSVLGQEASIIAGLKPLRDWREALRHFMTNRDHK
jgi:dTDP-4-dehydrorhamnose reductase